MNYYGREALKVYALPHRFGTESKDNPSSKKSSDDRSPNNSLQFTSELCQAIQALGRRQWVLHKRGCVQSASVSCLARKDEASSRKLPICHGSRCGCRRSEDVGQVFPDLRVNSGAWFWGSPSSSRWDRENGYTVVLVRFFFHRRKYGLETFFSISGRLPRGKKAGYVGPHGEGKFASKIGDCRTVWVRFRGWQLFGLWPGYQPAKIVELARLLAK